MSLIADPPLTGPSNGGNYPCNQNPYFAFTMMTTQRQQVLYLPIIVLLLICLAASPERTARASDTSGITAQKRESVAFEVLGGTAFSFPMPLKLKQEGYDDISFTAHYDTKPFNKHPYYAVRLGRWVDGKAWEVEMVHHKIYLNNNPDDVQHFEISHGYNLVTLNRAWDIDSIIYRVGLGIVVAHPESTVRNKKFYEMDGGLKGDGNYYVAGPTAQVAIQKKLHIWESLFVTGEAKLTASYATVPIADGDAVAPNTAFHILLGIGYDFKTN